MSCVSFFFYPGFTGTTIPIPPGIIAGNRASGIFQARENNRFLSQRYVDTFFDPIKVGMGNMREKNRVFCSALQGSNA